MRTTLNRFFLGSLFFLSPRAVSKQASSLVKTRKYLNQLLARAVKNASLPRFPFWKTHSPCAGEAKTRNTVTEVKAPKHALLTRSAAIGASLGKFIFRLALYSPFSPRQPVWHGATIHNEKGGA